MFRSARLQSLVAAVLALAAGGLAPAAGASTNAAGPFGEPTFTNSQSNTHWVEWTKFNSYYSFFLSVTPFVNGSPGGVSYSNYLGGVGANVNNVSGNEAVTWGAGPLPEGSSYGICASGQYNLDISTGPFPESQNSCSAAFISGRRTITTMDRTKPTIQVAVSGTDTYTKTVPIPVAISYNDNLAFPFPANYICARTGIEPAAAQTQCQAPGPAQHNYSNVCSAPANPSSKVTSFSCTVTDTPTLPDGPVTVCAIAADAAIPDNPSGPNQDANASQANLSSSQCGYVRLDRTVPQVSFTAPASVKVGDLVSVSGTVTDAGSGAGPVITWTWGDNTPNGAGVAPTHTYTQAGTYTVTMATADAVGNPAQATRTITVTAPVPPAGGGGTTPPPGGGSPGGGTSTGGGGTVTPPPTAQQIAQQIGASGGSAGATQTTSAGALDVLTARKVRITAKLRNLPLALTAEVAGEAQFALVRSGRIVAKAGLQITKPGSLGFKLKLPRKLKAGRYSMKISFTPKGTARASTKTISITFSAAKKKARRSGHAAARPSSASLVTGSPASGLPDGTVPAAVRRAARAGEGLSVP